MREAPPLGVLGVAGWVGRDDGINYGANLPIPKNGITNSAKVVLLTLSKRQIVKRAQVESVTYVEVVVTVIVVKLAESSRIVCRGAGLV